MPVSLIGLGIEAKNTVFYKTGTIGIRKGSRQTDPTVLEALSFVSENALCR